MYAIAEVFFSDIVGDPPTLTIFLFHHIYDLSFHAYACCFKVTRWLLIYEFQKERRGKVIHLRKLFVFSFRRGDSLQHTSFYILLAGTCPSLANHLPKVMSLDQ